MFEQITERWHIIEPYECYAVTESGKVYSFRNNNLPYQGLREMQLRGINDKRRYIQVCLSENGNCKYFQVHRLVARYFCHGYFNGAVVNHKDGNIHNNHYSNLEWVTQKDNIHLGYVTSGLDQTRNYKYYALIGSDGKHIASFRGMNAIKPYIKENNLNVSFTSLQKYKKSKGYEIVPITSSNSNDYPIVGVDAR